MRTRTRAQKQLEDQEDFYLEEESELDLESLTDEELEEFLFDEEINESKGIWNLPTVAGLSMILVGVVYLLQELNLLSSFPAIGDIVAMLPWLAGILIILLGFGVLSWRPKPRKKKKKQAVKQKTARSVNTDNQRVGPKKKLIRSKDKKIAGVAAGIAEYFNLDPTLVRIAFVIGTIVSGGTPGIIAYFIATMVMEKSDGKSTQEGRITIIRD